MKTSNLVSCVLYTLYTFFYKLLYAKSKCMRQPAKPMACGRQRLLLRDQLRINSNLPEFGIFCDCC